MGSRMWILNLNTTLLLQAIDKNLTVLIDPSIIVKIG
jgi:hypothetical protein